MRLQPQHLATAERRVRIEQIQIAVETDLAMPSDQAIVKCRWLRTACIPLVEWQALVRALEQPAAAADPRLSTADARVRHSAEIDGLLVQWLSNVSADGMAERLQRAGVCAHVSWNTADIARDPHLRNRGVTREVSGPDIPTRVAVGAPVRFSKTTEVGIRRLTPALGEDEDYVFGELLGLSSAQRADLEQREVIL